MWSSSGKWCQQHLTVQRRMSCQCSPESGPAKPEHLQSPVLQHGQGCPAWAVPMGQCGQAHTMARGQMALHLLKSCFPKVKLHVWREEWLCCQLLWHLPDGSGVTSSGLFNVLHCGSSAAPWLELAGGLASGKYPAKAYQYLSHNISKGKGFLLSHAHRSCPISRKLPRVEIVRMLRKEEN